MSRRALIVALAGALLVPVSAAAADSEPLLTGTWFDGLDAGICFDDAWDADGNFDYTVPAAVVPCEGPHQNEVVSRVVLRYDDFPSEDVVVPAVDEACAGEFEGFLGRPIEETLVFPFAIAPSAEDWASGARDGLCAIYTGEETLGTAASGSLRAPGETLAVYHEVEQKPDLWLVDAGTGEATRNLTDNDLVELITAPSWTPDGAAIAFSVQAGASAEESDVYLVSVADGAATPLIEGPAAEDGAVFSPDGSTIAFISDVDAEEYEIYSRVLETGETTRLTTFADRDSTPRWSPDGTRIAFRRRTDDVSDIWVMDADGSGATQLTGSAGSNYDPRWSPDGRRIAFTTDRAGNFDIGVMNADGSDEQLLTTHPSDDEFPSWSTDGQILAFHSKRHGGVSLWLMREDGSEQSELTGLAPVGFPMFAPVPVQ